MCRYNFLQLLDLKRVKVSQDTCTLVFQIMSQCKQLLLWVATPDAVVRLSKSGLVPQEQARMKQVYNERQAHDSIAQYLHQAILTEKRKQLFAQVTLLFISYKFVKGILVITF